MTMEDNEKIIKSFCQDEREMSKESIKEKMRQRRLAAKGGSNHNFNNTTPEINLNLSVFSRCSNPRLSPTKTQVNDESEGVTHTP